MPDNKEDVVPNEVPAKPEKKVQDQYGAICLECGNFRLLNPNDPLLLPTCGACGGKITTGYRSQIKKLVNQDRQKHGMGTLFKKR
jgi:hypothetical protein